MTGPNWNNPKDMHPDDKKNLLVFFVITILLFFLFDNFIHKPQMAKLQVEKARQAQLQAQKDLPEFQEAVEKSRTDALSASSRVTIDAPELTGSLSLTGARLDDLSFKNYFETTEREKMVTWLSPASTKGGQYAEMGWISNDTDVVLPSPTSVWSVEGNATLTPDTPVKLVWENGQGLRFEDVYKVDDHSLFTVERTVSNTSGNEITVYPYAVAARKNRFENMGRVFIAHEGPIGYVGDELHEVRFKDLNEEPLQSYDAATGWIGLTEKYWFLSVMMPQNQPTRFRYQAKFSQTDTTYQMDATGAAITIPDGEARSVTSHIIAGPKKVRQLNAYENDLGVPHLDLAVDFGMFYFLTRPFSTVLIFLGEKLGSFALAIIVFTMMLRLAVFPLANKSYRSFARMRKLAPQMKEVRETYKDDRVKMQQAIFELYQKEQVNPMAGCLPMLLQIPIFFALYKVLYNTIEMRHTPFYGWIEDMSAQDPTTIFNLFGLIPWDPPSALMIGAWPCLMFVTLQIQQKLSPPAQDPMQRQMMFFFPFFITLVLAKFPAGLVIYWTWSNCLSIIQQIVLMKQEGVDVHLFNIFNKKKDIFEVDPQEQQRLNEEGDEVIEHVSHEDEPQDKPVSAPKRKKKK